MTLLILGISFFIYLNIPQKKVEQLLGTKEMFHLKNILHSNLRIEGGIQSKFLMRSKEVGTLRFMSSQKPSAPPPQFDGETADLYAKVFKQHYHEHGPWKKMVEAAERVLQKNEKPKILDLATGPGEPGTLLAKRFPKGEVLLTDIAPDMVEKAKTLISDNVIKNATVKVMDAQDMTDIDDNSLDVITCCYGFMFCPEPEKAFSEAYRVLKPGGHLIGTVWVKMPGMVMLRNIMEKVLGKPPPPPPINPLSMGEEGTVENLIESAGMKMVESIESEYPFAFGNEPGDDPDIAFKLVTLPTRSVLTELAENGVPNAFEIAKEAFDKEVATELYCKLQPEGGLVTKPNCFKMFLAKKV